MIVGLIAASSIIAIFMWALVKIAGDTDRGYRGYHFEKIRCPNCGCIQFATVAHAGYSWDRTHKCKFCDYWIFASEWDLVKGAPITKGDNCEE